MTLKHSSFQHGFSLIELAIVLFIVSLLLGGLLVPLTAQIDQQRAKETQKTLAELKESLIGFAIVHGRLPCPAIPNSMTGLENPVGGPCSNFFNGLVPAATLGITPVNGNGLLVDGWNNPIRYAVTDFDIGLATDAFTTSNGMKTATLNSLALATPLLVVCSSSSGNTLTTCGGTAITLTNNAPVIVYSLGKNGGTLSTDLDELANTDGNTVFVSHEQTSTFDDLVIWLSPHILINRMVTAGQLP